MIKHLNNKSFYVKQKAVYPIAIISVGMLYPTYVNANNFADVPLHLQSTSTTTSAYSVKPNVTLFIDDSGSMNEATTPVSYKCKKRTRYRLATGGWSSWTTSPDYVATFDEKPSYTLPDSNSPATETFYGGDCVNTTKLDIVKEVLTSIVQKYRNNLYFNLQPFNNFYNDDTKYTATDPESGTKTVYDLNRFYDTSKDLEYNIFLQQINGGKDTKLLGLRPSGGTYTTRRYAAVARNIVMNKLRYRCQKSYVVLMTDGVEDAGNYPWTDSPFWAKWGDSSKVDYYDGYFDSYRHQDYQFLDPYNVCQKPFKPQYTSDNNIKKLAYYTNTLATKSFGGSAIKLITEGKNYQTNCTGTPISFSQYDPDKNDNQTAYHPYIYNMDYRQTDGWGVPSYKAEPKTTDAAGRPWDDWVDPDDHTKGRFKQVATTFTIGVGLGTNTKSQVISTLRNAATEANADSTQTDGFYKDNKGMPYDMVISPKPSNFFNANSRQEILDAFKNAFENIVGEVEQIQKPITTNTPNFSVATPTNFDTIKVQSTIDTGTWSSTLRISTDKDKDDNYTSPSFTNRQLILGDGNNTYLYPNNLGHLNNQTFNIPNNNSNKNEWKDGLLAWLSRAKSDAAIQQQAKDNNFALNYRQRISKTANRDVRNMGDIIDNSVVTAGPTINGRPEFLVTSTNDGMVYAFKSTTDSQHPYDLKFNYMPLGMQRSSLDNSDTVDHYYRDLTNNTYGVNTKTPHRFLLNGGIAVRETEGDHPLVFMASTMGQAGRGVFALKLGGYDLQNPDQKVAADNLGDSSWYKNVTLFHSPNGSQNKFGYTVGTPVIYRLRYNSDYKQNNPAQTEFNQQDVNSHIRQAVFVGSGFNFPDQNNANNTENATETALYIYDPLGLDVGKGQKQASRVGKSGTLIRKLIVPNGVGGLASPTVVDIDNNGTADFVYAGDFGGNMYRFNIMNPDPDNWTVTKIFSSLPTDHAPITSAPAVYKNTSKQYIVVFGTGSEIYQDDNTNKNQQFVYGIYDNLENVADSAMTRNDLLQQNLSGIGSDVRTLTQNKFSSGDRNGWYFALSPSPDGQSSSEHVILKPQIVNNTVLLSSHAFTVETKEAEDPCIQTTSTTQNNMVSYQFQFDVHNGGALTSLHDFHIYWKKGSNVILSVVADKGYNTIQFTLPANEINPNGDNGASGKDIPLKKSNFIYDVAKNPDGTTTVNMKETAPTDTSHCLNFQGHVSSSSGNDSIQSEGGLCSVNIRRLSWREIYESYGNL